jgi:hypothetical protein
MCSNSTGRAQAFLSACDAAVSQKVADGKISIKSACPLNTRYIILAFSGYCNKNSLLLISKFKLLAHVLVSFPSK